MVHVDHETLKDKTAGRKTRSIPPALKRGLNSRDKGCVFPGCTHQKYVDGHHVHHWAERDLHIDPQTARTRWRGESMDYGLAIDVLLAKRRGGRRANQPDEGSLDFRASTS